MSEEDSSYLWGVIILIIIKYGGGGFIEYLWSDNTAAIVPGENNELCSEQRENMELFLGQHG